MNLKAISSAVASKLARPMLQAQKHSPTLLFGAGVVGVVATVVLASKATLKLESVLEETEKNVNTAKNLEHTDYSEADRNKDLTLIYAKAAMQIGKLYGPAVVVGVASIAALTGSHMILNKRNVGLTAAYATLERGFNEYRKRVSGELGEEKERELRYGHLSREIVEETDEGPVVKNVPVGDRSMYARLFDRYTSQSWQDGPGYNQMFLNCQQNYANDLLNARGHVFLNEVYDMLGLERTPEGQVVGWVKHSVDDGGDGFIDFGIIDGNVHEAILFINGDEKSIWLDFNVDGVVYDKI